MNVLGQVAGILAVATLVPAAWGQAPAAPAAPATPRRAAVAKPAQKVVVRNVSGTPIEGVRIAISGARTEEAKTNAEGVVSLALAAGSYRLRFEHEGFITLERDVTVRTAPLDVAVVLNRAPASARSPARACRRTAAVAGRAAGRAAREHLDPGVSREVVRRRTRADEGVRPGLHA